MDTLDENRLNEESDDPEIADTTDNDGNPDQSDNPTLDVADEVETLKNELNKITVKLPEL